jgi:hypothetical protein
LGFTPSVFAFLIVVMASARCPEPRIISGTWPLSAVFTWVRTLERSVAFEGYVMLFTTFSPLVGA